MAKRNEAIHVAGFGAEMGSRVPGMTLPYLGPAALAD
jgi:hypothetical protein